MKSPIYLLLIGAIAFLSLLGCAEKAQKADASRARGELRRALDAWKSGEGFEAYQAKVAPAVVSDPQWEKGMKLLSYDLEEKESPSGYDVKFVVKLSLEDGSGKKTEQKAAYTVSTAPAFVVTRDEDSR
jgi:hypothetical protein